MKSISKHLTAQDVVAQIRMERQKHKGVFFLMEGSTDKRRFEKFFEESRVSTVICWGKSNVIDAINIIQNTIHEDCLGLVDADFDRITNSMIDNEDIIYSEYHDFDMDICRSEVIKRYLSEVAEPTQLHNEGGSSGLVSALLEALRPLSAMRFACQKHGLRYSFENLHIDKFFDGSTIDVTAMIDCVSTSRFANPADKSVLHSYITRYCATKLDLWHFTNGHDFIASLGIALRNRIAERRLQQTWRQEVERHLRLAFDYSDFLSCGISRKIKLWQSNKGHPAILRQLYVA